MPLVLPAALIARKNAIAQDAPWLQLFEIEAPEETLRFVNNTDDVVWGGNTYSAFPIELDEIKNDGSGSFGTFSARVCNVNRVVQDYVEANDGLVGCTVRLIVVNAGELAADVSMLTTSWSVMSTKCDENWVVFSLGRSVLLSRRYPKYRALPSTCPLHYKGARCGYAGVMATCDRTLNACRDHDNAPRFGGRPGLQAKGARSL